MAPTPPEQTFGRSPVGLLPCSPRRHMIVGRCVQHLIISSRFRACWSSLPPQGRPNDSLTQLSQCTEYGLVESRIDVRKLAQNIHGNQSHAAPDSESLPKLVVGYRLLRYCRAATWLSNNSKKGSIRYTVGLLFARRISGSRRRCDWRFISLGPILRHYHRQHTVETSNTESRSDAPCRSPYMRVWPCRLVPSCADDMLSGCVGLSLMPASGMHDIHIGHMIQIRW